MLQALFAFFSTVGTVVFALILVVAAAVGMGFATAFLLAHLSEICKLKSDAITNNGSLLSILASFLGSIWLIHSLGVWSAFLVLLGMVVCLGLAGFIAMTVHESRRMKVQAGQSFLSGFPYQDR